MYMTGLGTLLFLVGIGVLIFGLVSFRRKNWPRKKTQIIIISSILAIIIGVGIIPTTDEEASTEEPTKQEEKTEKVDNTPILKAERLLQQMMKVPWSSKGKQIQGQK